MARSRFVRYWAVRFESGTIVVSEVNRDTADVSYVELIWDTSLPEPGWLNSCPGFIILDSPHLGQRSTDIPRSIEELKTKYKYLNWKEVSPKDIGWNYN